MIDVLDDFCSTCPPSISNNPRAMDEPAKAAAKPMEADPRSYLHPYDLLPSPDFTVSISPP